MLTSNTSLLLEMVVYQGANLWCDTSTGALRPLVPVSQRRAIFQQVHELSHAGRRATRRLVAARFVWPGLAADVVTKAAQHHRGEDGDPHSQVQPCARGHCGAAPTIT